MSQRTSILIHKPIASTKLWTAGLCRYPTTPGQVTCLSNDPANDASSAEQQQILFDLSTDDYLESLLFFRRVSNVICKFMSVHRCAMAYDGAGRAHLIPFHGLSKDWHSITSPKEQIQDKEREYPTTSDGPHWPSQALDDLQHVFRAQAKGPQMPDNTFHGPATDDNLFARLVRGEVTQWRVWEDEHHVAFLTPFANVRGACVVIPRSHLTSNIFALQKSEFKELVLAARTVAHLMQQALGVRHVGMFFEGFEIDYAHVKLQPASGKSFPIEKASAEEWHETYPGYLTTKLGLLADYEDALDRVTEGMVRIMDEVQV